MGSDKLSIKGKAVVVKEEVSLPDTPSPAVFDGQKIRTVKKVEDGDTSHGDSSQSAFIKGIIMHCVVSLGMWNIVAASTALQAISSFATTMGDSLRRVAFTFAEALACRAMGLVPGLAWALQLQVPPPTTPVATNAARLRFAELYPAIRVAATAANHAILEATAAELAVHVVDLGGASPNQWLELLSLFAARPCGPPSLRLTVVNEQDDSLSRAAGILTQEAVRLHVPFVFNPVRSHIDRFSALTVAAFGVVHGPGEALVISSTLKLHRLIADEVTIELPAAGHNNDLEQTTSHQITRADALLGVLRDQMPKLMVLMEQEADHNGADLSDRVSNAFDYYTVLFRDLEAAGSVDRDAVERVLLREEVMDIVAHDGAQRRERHEKMARWAQRMQVAGFEPAPVSVGTFEEAAILAHQLSGSGDGGLCMYVTHRVEKGCLFVLSRNRPIFSVSVWMPVQRSSELSDLGAMGELDDDG